MTDADTTIILLRHGRTEWNQLGKLQGACDSPLLPESLNSARASGARLRASRYGSKVTAVYTSPIPRASRTAGLVVEGLGRPGLAPRPRDGLRERSFGGWEGKSWGQIEREAPDELAAYRRDREWVIPGGGESSAGAGRRFVGAMTAIAAAHAGETVVVVTHSNAMSQFMTAMLRIEPGVDRAYALENDAINVVVWRAEKRRFHLELWGDRGQFAAAPAPLRARVERGGLVALGIALGFVAGRHRWLRS